MRRISLGIRILLLALSIGVFLPSCITVKSKEKTTTVEKTTETP